MGMITSRFLSSLVGGTVLATLAIFAFPAQAARDWLATGTVTKIEGSTLFSLGKDNSVYTIDASSSGVVFENSTADCSSVRIGDKVRIFGHPTGPYMVKAVRVRAFSRGEDAIAYAEPEQEIKVIMERREPEYEPAAPAAGPGPQQCPNWEGRGLISDIDYSGRGIKFLNSDGVYSINTGGAILTNNSGRIGFGLLHVGDAISIAGNVGGLNEVNAVRINVERTRTDSEGALPQNPVSVVGTIQNIDYPSRTIRMATAGPPIVVSIDDNTVIQQQTSDMLFAQLRPGMRVKVSGIGAPASGYAAYHIQVIGTGPL